MRLEERSFVTIIIFGHFPPRKSALKFQTFRSKLLITFDLISVDNFWGQIWNQCILLVNIPKNEESWRSVLITSHAPAHRDNSRHGHSHVQGYHWISHWKEGFSCNRVHSYWQNNSSLAFGRTSAGIVWCFFGLVSKLNYDRLYGPYRKENKRTFFAEKWQPR